MNQDNERPDLDIADPQVSLAYRSMTEVSTPAKLDAAVLDEARVAASRDRPAFSIGGWLRPAAFMATVGLSLAVLLEFRETEVFDSVPQIATEPDDRYRPAAGGADRAQAREDDAAQAFGQLPAKESAISDPKTPLADSAPPPAPGQLDNSADSSMLPDQPLDQPSPAAESLPDNTALDSAIGQTGRSLPQTAAVSALHADAARHCGDEQTRSADTWWQCIEALREADQAEAARQEFELFIAAFPDFRPAR